MALELAVVGGSEFVLGFQLTGIKKIFEIDGNAEEAVTKALADPAVGIIIIDEHIIGQLDERLREKLHSSIRPVAVPVSTTSSQENLRRMIRKAIGIDVLGG